MSQTLPRERLASARLRNALYLVCVLTDFAAFVVVFTVSRGLAERNAPPWYLGLVGAGLSCASGVASLAGGWLAQRCDGRAVFLAGAGLMTASAALCAAIPVSSQGLVPAYWLMGLGLGLLYPPLIGWLNRDEDPHRNSRGVSRTLILFCVSWNLGMMAGQVTAGALYARGTRWVYGAALVVCVLNMAWAAMAARRVTGNIAATVAARRGACTTAELAAGFKRLGWIANLGGMFGGSMVIHLLPALAVGLGVPADTHATILAAWRGVIILTYLVMHHSAFWHYRMAAAMGSQLLAVAGLMIIAAASSAAGLLMGLALLGQLVGYNYFAGLYYSTAGSSREGRALSAGIHEATLAAGMAIGTLLGGMLGSVVDQRMPYRLAAGVVIVLIAAQCAAWVKWILPLRARAAQALLEAAND